MAQTNLQVQALKKQVVPTSDLSHPETTDIRYLSRAILGLANNLSISTDTSGNVLFWDQNHPTLYYEQLIVPSLSANVAITWPAATGTLLTNATGQTLTDPTITNGLTATGSVANDFSGSTGTFLTSTGAVTLGGGTNAVTINGPLVDKSAAINAAGSTAAPTAAQSGQTFALDTASGSVITLPTPAVGLTYHFIVTVSVTSNSHEIKTSGSSVFLQGVTAQIGSATTFGFAADGSTIQAIKSNGTTTGGLIGTQYTVTCISATKWLVTGVNVASGTAATPFTATP